MFFPHVGNFFLPVFLFFTSSYNFEVNRHEKVSQKSEKPAAPNVEMEKLEKDDLIFMSSKIRSSYFHRSILVSCRINSKLFFVSSNGISYNHKRGNFSLINSPLD